MRVSCQGGDREFESRRFRTYDLHLDTLSGGGFYLGGH